MKDTHAYGGAGGNKKSLRVSANDIDNQGCMMPRMIRIRA